MACVVALWAATAHADDDERIAHAHYIAAQHYADEGAYEKALDEYRESYRLSHYPAILYYIALCQEHLGALDEARRTFADYLAADPTTPRRERVEARIRNLERRENSLPIPPFDEPNPEPERAPGVASSPKQATTPRTSAPPGPQHRDRLIALGLGAGTVAFAAVAIGFSVDALQLHDKLAQSYGVADEATRRAQRDTLVEHAAIADAFWAATAVAAVVTGYFVYRGFRHRHEAARLTLLPAAGAVAAWSF